MFSGKQRKYVALICACLCVPLNALNMPSEANMRGKTLFTSLVARAFRNSDLTFKWKRIILDTTNGLLCISLNNCDNSYYYSTCTALTLEFRIYELALLSYIVLLPFSSGLQSFSEVQNCYALFGNNLCMSPIAMTH